MFGWWKAAEHVGLKAPIALISASAGFRNCRVRITPKSQMPVFISRWLLFCKNQKHLSVCVGLVFVCLFLVLYWFLLFVGFFCLFRCCCWVFFLRGGAAGWLVVFFLAPHLLGRFLDFTHHKQ